MLGGTWVVLAGSGAGDADAVAGVLRGRGAAVVVAGLPAGAGAGAVAGLLPGGELGGAVFLAGRDPGRELLVVVQALAGVGSSARLWAVTRGAVGTGPADPPADPVAAQVWGLGRVVALEQPGRWGGLADVPAGAGGREWELWAGLLTGSEEDQVAVRSAGVYGRRFSRAAPAAGARQWRPRGTVLITGGTGALGGHVARWAAGAGADHLILVSRQGAGATGAGRLAADLSAAGARVTFAACDVADREALAAVLAGAGPVSAVVHAAGVAGGGLAADMDADGFGQVLAAKVAGTGHLLDLVDVSRLDAFVLFSSNAGVWGGAGQGAYAAANAYLDALALAQRSAGNPVTSIAWGPWQGPGMAQGEGGRQLRRLGLRPLPPQLAMGVLAQAVGQGEGFLAVADIYWDNFAPVFTSVRPSPFLAGHPRNHHHTLHHTRRHHTHPGASRSS